MARRGRRGRPRNLSATPASPLTVTPPPRNTETKEDNSIRQEEDNPEPSSPAETKRPTYASLLDTDEGNHLRYIPASIINGTRCTQIEMDNVAQEVEYWQNAVLCSVLGANPPFEVMKGFINRIWTKFEIKKNLLVKKGLFLV